MICVSRCSPFVCWWLTCIVQAYTNRFWYFSWLVGTYDNYLLSLPVGLGLEPNLANSTGSWPVQYIGDSLSVGLSQSSMSFSTSMFKGWGFRGMLLTVALRTSNSLFELFWRRGFWYFHFSQAVSFLIFLYFRF